MLRFCISAILLSFLMSTGASAAVYGADHGDIREINDYRPVPWPWSLAAPFPWRDIQGMWKVEQDGFVSYFALKVVNVKPSGDRQLVVRQIDGYSCKVIATGVGFETKQSVKAQMTDDEGHTYRVSLTAFNAEDAAETPKKGRVQTTSVMVLSLGTLGAPSSTNLHWQITKVANTISQKSCVEDVNR